MLTEVQKVDGIWLKRDDLFTAGNANGGKARTLWELANRAKKEW